MQVDVETKSELSRFHTVLEREAYVLASLRDARLFDVLVEIDELKSAVERALDALRQADRAAG